MSFNYFCHNIAIGCAWLPPTTIVPSTELLLAEYRYQGSSNHSPNGSIFQVSGQNIIINQESVSGTSQQAVIRRSSNGGASWGATEPLPAAQGNTPVPHQFYWHPTQGWWIYAFWLANRVGSRFRHNGVTWISFPWPDVHTGYPSNEFGWQSFTGDGDDFIFAGRYAYNASSPSQDNNLYVGRRTLELGTTLSKVVLDPASNGWWPPQKMNDGTWVVMAQLPSAGTYGTYPVYHINAGVSAVLTTASFTNGGTIIDMQTDGETVWWTLTNSDLLYRYKPGGVVTTIAIPGAYGSTGTSSLHVADNGRMWLAVSINGNSTDCNTAYSLDKGDTWTVGPVVRVNRTINNNRNIWRQLRNGDNGEFYLAYNELSQEREVLVKFNYGDYVGDCW